MIWVLLILCLDFFFNLIKSLDAKGFMLFVFAANKFIIVFTF